MNIKELPTDYESFERFSVAYERDHYKYSDANHRVGGATRDMFIGWFPRLLHPIVRPAIYAMLEDPLIEGFGFPRPTKTMRRLVTNCLRLRAGIQRCLPGRRKPFLRTEMRHRTYPNGYAIEQLGPPVIA
jgi:hypothetical protein